MQNPFR